MAEIQQLDTERLNPKPAEPDAGDKPALSPEPAKVATAPPEPLTWDQIEDLRQRIIAALCTCFDPEIPVNIYELGLIYDITIAPTGAVAIRMTLTSPACPVAGTLPPGVQRKIEALPGVASAKVDVVWEPPWDK